MGALENRCGQIRPPPRRKKEAFKSDQQRGIFPATTDMARYLILLFLISCFLTIGTFSL